VYTGMISRYTGMTSRYAHVCVYRYDLAGEKPGLFGQIGNFLGGTAGARKEVPLFISVVNLLKT